MTVHVNGSPDDRAEGRSLAAYVESAGYRLDRVAVEVNGDIVPKTQYDSRTLADGDRVEIVHFVGGG